jgi:hypothetical protein
MQLRRNRRELGVQFGAKAIHDRGDRDRDAGSDQAIFNRGDPGLVFEKCVKGDPT